MNLRSQRNYGVDLLRVGSMFMIIILHSLGHGGLLKSVDATSILYNAAWLLETAAYCAVNCYALISGYVGLGSRFKLSNLIRLWLQVLFYNVIFTLLGAVVQQTPITPSLIVAGLTPITSGAYWYFTAYCGAFFFMPLINSAVEHMPKRQLTAVLCGILVFFSLCTTLRGVDIFKLNAGYHALWLSVLYAIGAYIKKYHPLEGWSARRWALIYLGLVLLSWGNLLLQNHLNSTGLIPEFQLPNLIRYISPTILLCAISLLMLFSKIKVSGLGARLVALLSPLTFGVYLIHDSSWCRNTLIKERLAGLADDHVVLMILKVLLFAAVVYAICSALDLLRNGLFKALGVQKLADCIDNKILHQGSKGAD